MRVERYSEDAHRDLWEGFVEERARNGHFMHLRRYLDYHGGRFDDHSLLVFGDKPDPIALLPAHVSENILVSHGGLSFGGFLVGERFRFAQWSEIFLTTGEYLRENQFEGLDYRPTPPWYHSQPGEDDVFLIESSGVQPELQASAIRRMDGEFTGNPTRRNESKTEVSVTRDDAALGDVMDLVAETLRARHGTSPVHTRAEMEGLARKFPEQINCFVARMDGRLVAAVVVMISPAALKLQYVGYTDNRAMSSIYAHLFSQEKFTGRWFDFGTSMADGGVDAGLLAYKESLGAKLAPVRRYVLQAGSAPLKKKLDLQGEPELIELPTVPDERGSLTFAERDFPLPFRPSRTYWVHGVPAGSTRGGHAHKATHEAIIAATGSFRVSLTNQLHEQRVFILASPTQALYVPPMWWRDIDEYTDGAVCLVMASLPFSEDDYVRQPDEFFIG